MTTRASRSSSLIFALEDRMPHGKAARVGLRQVLAVIVGIISPPLVVTRALGFSTESRDGDS